MPETQQEILEGKAEQTLLKDVKVNQVQLITDKSTINLPDFSTVADFYEKLEFNPNGINLHQLALTDPTGAYWALKIKDETLTQVKNTFPQKHTIDNFVDAFRHAYFSFRLSQKIGIDRTKQFTDAYEISNINKIGSRCMDLWNNKIGRALFKESTAPKDIPLTAKKAVEQALQQKRLITSPLKISIPK